MRAMMPRDVADQAHTLAAHALDLASTGCELDEDLLRTLAGSHDRDVLAVALCLVAIRCGTLLRQLEAVRA